MNYTNNTGGDKVLLFRIGWRRRAKSWIVFLITCPVAAGLVTFGVVDDQGGMTHLLKTAAVPLDLYRGPLYPSGRPPTHLAFFLSELLCIQHFPHP
jgi:hypothetical protein